MLQEFMDSALDLEVDFLDEEEAYTITKFFIDDEHDGDFIGEDVDKIKEKFVQLWSESKYAPNDINLFLMTLEFSTFVDFGYLTEFLKKTHTIITKKDLKKGRKGVVNRLLRKYHKENFREELTFMFSFVNQKELKQLIECQDEPSKEKLTECINDIGFPLAYWFATSILSDQELTSRLENENKKEYIKMLLAFYGILSSTNYTDIMERPETLNNNELDYDISKLKNENKRLKMKANKVTQSKSVLLKEVHSLNQEKKKLKGEIYSLYNDSLDEIEVLKVENNRLTSNFQEEREFLVNTINDLSDHISQLQTQLYNETDLNTPHNLNGEGVCVIGGNKERYYAEKVAKFNGELFFVAEDQFNKIEGAINRSSIVFYLTELVGHHHFRKALSCSQKKGIPFIFINSKGISTFELNLISFINSRNNKMPAAK